MKTYTVRFGYLIYVWTLFFYITMSVYADELVPLSIKLNFLKSSETKGILCFEYEIQNTSKVMINLYQDIKIEQEFEVGKFQREEIKEQILSDYTEPDATDIYYPCLIVRNSALTSRCLLGREGRIDPPCALAPGEKTVLTVAIPTALDPTGKMLLIPFIKKGKEKIDLKKVYQLLIPKDPKEATLNLLPEKR